MSCEHDCRRPALVPAEIRNRPGLARIRYRIGEYASFREHMLDRLNKSSLLAGWTHRGADEPAIALLEAAAEVGDILTFYQELYANEAYLRTAQWRESVTALVRLTGYRLAPGIGGEATFVVTVTGENSVTVPKGFGFRASLEGRDQPAEFESVAETLARPALSRFRLYRPRLEPQEIEKGDNRLEWSSEQSAAGAESPRPTRLKAGDRLFLMSASGSDESAEIVIVKEVTSVLDRTIVTFEGALTVKRGQTVQAYPIRRSFRHFGHAAPPLINGVDEKTGEYASVPTEFHRKLGVPFFRLPVAFGDGVPAAWVTSQQDVQPLISWPGPRFFGDAFEFLWRPRILETSEPGNGSEPAAAKVDPYSELQIAEIPLDVDVGDLAAGNQIICEGFQSDAGADKTRFAALRVIEGLRSATLTWGGQSGASTVLTLDKPPLEGSGTAKADIRTLRFHEVTGPPDTLRAQSTWSDGPFASGDMVFYGALAEAQALAERELLLEGPGGEQQTVHVTTPAAPLTSPEGNEHQPLRWCIALHPTPAFPQSWFDEENPRVWAYGNLIHATQGKSEREAALGSGDRRRTFQTFPLPKSPLTYLLNPTQDPAQSPELTVFVDGVRWERVNELFGSGPGDAVYVVREESDGTSYLQFGDGKAGARLPSGRNNVVARFRTGIGARGRLQPGAKPSATGKLPELAGVLMPAPAVGGAEAEPEDIARTAAPGRLQSLGRMVSLADIESEALALPGVLKARAYWAAHDGVARVELAVLAENGAPAATGHIQDLMNTYNRCRGPARHPIHAIEAVRHGVRLVLRVSYDPARRVEELDRAVRAALGVAGQERDGIDGSRGLFGLASRQLGESVYLSQIVAAVQQVPGIRRVEADAAHRAPLEPAEAMVSRSLACGPHEILVLHRDQLDLLLTVDQRAEGCQP